MVQWFTIILIYDLTIFKLALSEVTLSLRLLHYTNRNGLTYENHRCDTRIEDDINRDGRCDTAFLFCLVRLPFQNPHNCTLGDYFTGLVGADDIHFINIDEQSQDIVQAQQRSSALTSLWFQPTLNFRFKYPKTGIGLIVEVYDVDDANNHTIHDSIDFYGRTLLDLKIYSSKELALKQRVYLRSLFGSYTNLTVELSLYCSTNYYGNDCETFCLPNEKRYNCDLNTGQKICKHGYFGSECLDDVRVCDDHSCLNNGTCVVYIGGYFCQCQKGFSGHSCEMILNDEKQSACTSRPCLHESTCENFGSTYRCHCRVDYTGRNCETSICEQIRCIHGHCVKRNSYNVICICDENWTGNDCSERKYSNETNSLLKTELNEYLNWLNINYGVTKTPPRFLLPTTTTIITPLQPLETKYTPCLNSPCLHNSTCIGHSKNTFQCICPPSFVGLYCEIEILKISHFQQNPCENDPCRHQSVCIPHPNQTFQCLCQTSYTGQFCEHPIPFRLGTIFKKCSRLCHNGGICLIDETNREQCVCKSSYAGLNCELQKKNCLNSTDLECHSDPCLSNPCLSNGTCQSFDSLKNFTCSCVNEYTGERCESQIISNRQIQMDLWPLAIVFGYVFSLALVFIIIWFIWYGLTLRPQTSLTYGECVNDRYQLNRLSVNNPIFYTNQEYHTPLAKAGLTSPTTISNHDQWTRTINH